MSKVALRDVASVADGVLLCPRHHTLAHDSRYQLKTDKHGKFTFSKRT